MVWALVLGTMIVGVATADRYYASPIAVWKEVGGVPGTPPTEWRMITSAGDTILIDSAVKTPGPDPGPTPGTLEQRSYARANAVNEPSAALKIALNYEAGATLMSRDGKSWAEARANVDALNSLVIRTTTKKDQWTRAIAAMDADLSDEPQAAVTWKQVAAGFKRASTAGGQAAVEAAIDWMKLITCFIGIFTGEQSTVGDMIEAIEQSQTPQQPTPARTWPPKSNAGINRLFDQRGIGGTPLPEQGFQEVK